MKANDIITHHLESKVQQPSFVVVEIRTSMENPAHSLPHSKRSAYSGPASPSHRKRCEVQEQNLPSPPGKLGIQRTFLALLRTYGLHRLVDQEHWDVCRSFIITCCIQSAHEEGFFSFESLCRIGVPVEC